MNSNTKELLEQVGMSPHESRLYYTLLKYGPSTHLQLSRITGINRSKVYRVTDALKERSLVAVRVDDSGSHLVASDPETIGVSLTARQNELEQSRAAYTEVMPALQELASKGDAPLNFAMQTYDGIAGFRQMLWHELSAKGELLVFNDGLVEDLAGSARWAEKYRMMALDAGYTIRALLAPDDIDCLPESVDEEYARRHEARVVGVDDLPLLPMTHQITVYNNTVATYCYRDGQKVGYEVTNAAHADFYRAIFNKYWG